MKQKQVYDPLTVIIHWLTAIVVIGLFAVGFWMVDLNYYSKWYQTAPFWHKSVGICLAIVTVFRLLWKLLAKSPVIEGARWEIVSAKIAHFLLYLMMFGIFMSGYLISTEDGRAIDVFNWFSVPAMGELFPDQSDIAGEIHEYLAYGLIGLAVIHALAALKHHFINKDNTLKKMLGVK
ncbi:MULTISPECIES: cytochrome b [Photobacterium]|uniref:Cytochrome B561 n=1 Tax=Photobacterium ganghwense TaxID=320778 RepID=A0A0J1HG78_9GAMM|nr:MULTISPECIES: cytochrome b [Photobacterium]KLV10656.1 cytochrome B561 [Photobacterium ganghwense]MBV1841936.1 cytochrome b [Photobacterium ganghwense]PSU09759.1 cytochrome b [Photobacterium ganghwense]QSV17008.1 cytochrome b [Photobacterium ganghwense]